MNNSRFSDNTITTIKALFESLTLDNNIFVKYTKKDDKFYYDLYYFVTKIDETNFTENNYNISDANNFIKINFVLNNRIDIDQEVKIDMEITYENSNTINLIDFLPEVNPSYRSGGIERDVYNTYRNGNITFSDAEAILEEISDKNINFNNLDNIIILTPKINDPSFGLASDLLKKFICKYGSCKGRIQMRIISDTKEGMIIPAAGGKKSKKSKKYKTKCKKYKTKSKKYKTKSKKTRKTKKIWMTKKN